MKVNSQTLMANADEVWRPLNMSFMNQMAPKYMCWLLEKNI